MLYTLVTATEKVLILKINKGNFFLRYKKNLEINYWSFLLLLFLQLRPRVNLKKKLWKD